MSHIRALSDTSVLVIPVKPPKVRSERAIAREAAYTDLRKMVQKLVDESKVFQVNLEEGEKPLTIRQRIISAAAAEGKQVVVRKHNGGFAVGLWTPERQSNRGRKPAPTA